MGRLNLDIELALQWAYQREMLRHDGLFGATLPRMASPGWTRMIDTGVPIDMSHDHGTFPAGAGAPHPDALVIDYAVRSLPEVRVDWKRDRRHLMGELAPWIGEHDPICGLMATSPTVSVDLNHRGRGFASARVGPRPMVEPYELTPAVSIMMFARLGKRPEWRVGDIRVVRGKPALIGRQKGKNLYTVGSHCPLAIDPPPQEIAAARFEYMVWHNALVALAGVNLKLRDIALQYPRAPAAPWVSGEEVKAPPRRVVPVAPSMPTDKRLRLKPERELTLPQEETAKGGAVRHVQLTTDEDRC